jgi:hypothetical protein
VFPLVACIYNNKNILKNKEKTTIVLNSILLPLLVRGHIEFCGRVRKSLMTRCSDGSEIALTHNPK